MAKRLHGLGIFTSLKDCDNQVNKIYMIGTFIDVYYTVYPYRPIRNRGLDRSVSNPLRQFENKINILNSISNEILLKGLKILYRGFLMYSVNKRIKNLKINLKKFLLFNFFLTNWLNIKLITYSKKSLYVTN